LARNQRSPKRPPEPQPSGAHPEEVAVEKDGEAFPLRVHGGTVNCQEIFKRDPGVYQDDR